MNGDPSICNGCGLSEPKVRFTMRKVDGKSYRNHLCSTCRSEYKKKYPSSAETQYKATSKYRSKRSLLRASGEIAEVFIYDDCRKFDKKRGLVFDLTRERIREIIKSGCAYCGEEGIRVGLDRIDNSRGHEENNVVAACARCNYLRRDMPHEAWMMIVPSVRAVREAGAFGSWDGFGRKRIFYGEVP